jgi:tetratricopeptide (TPR) repeat protein
MKARAVVLAIGWILVFGAASGLGQSIPPEAMGFFTRGLALGQKAASPADIEAAIREFEQAVKLVPDWPAAVYNLAVTQDRAEKYADAIASYRRCLQLNPGPAEAEEIKGRIEELEFLVTEDEVGGEMAFEMMASGSYGLKPIGTKDLTSRTDLIMEPLTEFRSGERGLEVNNWWYDAAKKGYSYHPDSHPPISRGWEPVRTEGRFYEYSYSYYIDSAIHAEGGSLAYVTRHDVRVKGEIISNPPLVRIRETVALDSAWGAPIEGNKRAWRADYNTHQEKEFTYELIKLIEPRKRPGVK